MRDVSMLDWGVMDSTKDTCTLRRRYGDTLA